jgi:hypothetical protein
VSKPAVLLAIAAAVIALVLTPATAFGHGLSGLYESPLPLEVYLAGAAAAVALSFAIAFASQRRWQPSAPGAVIHAPRVLIVALKAIGLVALLWILAQVVIGGSSDAAVDTLFTWVYGWVGVAIISALIGPVWSWLDPFSTIYDAGAWIGRGLGLSGWRQSTYPPALASWPAVVGFYVFVWLELAYLRADMGTVVAVYTVVTLAGMLLFGKDAWRKNAEVFSVWFGLLGRLALFAPAGTPESGAVRPQRFLDGLLGRTWDRSLVTLVAIATGAILYDGLSQTETFFEVFGLPDIAPATYLLTAFLAIIAGLALLVGRRVGLPAIGAGMLPISLGYLIAHYLTFLLSDGQRILIAISDPFQLGWDTFDTAFFEPSIDWLPASIIWAVIFVSVVGGHVLGAWAGHQGVRTDEDDVSRARLVQLPLAAMMVLLTTLTLWSLGQGVISESTTSAQDAETRVAADDRP